MIAVIVPERVPWEASVRETLGPHRVFRLPPSGRVLSRLPAARRIRARLLLRRTIGPMAAAWLPRGVEVVLAPSLCAAEVFAVARRRGIRTVLLEDLPDLAGLHADLEAAARRHPDQPFLHNARASARVVARQAFERTLADELRVQGRFAAQRGGGEALVPPTRPRPWTYPRTGHFGLAGPAMTRTGALEALAVLERFPDHRLRIRAIDATPRQIVAHPRVVRGEGPVDVVLAPAWVESWPAAVRRASSAGIPVVGTRRALGWEPGVEHEPGDVDGLARAIRTATTRADASVA